MSVNQLIHLQKHTLKGPGQLGGDVTVPAPWLPSPRFLSVSSMAGETQQHSVSSFSIIQAYPLTPYLELDHTEADQ